jgi:hypothetical protein
MVPPPPFDVRLGPLQTEARMQRWLPRRGIIIMHHTSIIIVPSHRSRDRSHLQISSQPKDSSVVRVKMGYSSYYFYGLGISWISIFIIVGLYLLFTGESLPPLDRDRMQ